MRDLLRVAAQRGLSVHATHLPMGVLGCYEKDEKRIWFDIGLTPTERRVVIAHELGHDHYGDECSESLAERRADHYAASLLIDPDEYARLARIDPDIEALAEAFQVTTDCILDFRSYCLKRIGSATYIKRPHARELRIA